MGLPDYTPGRTTVDLPAPILPIRRRSSRHGSAYDTNGSDLYTPTRGRTTVVSSLGETEQNETEITVRLRQRFARLGRTRNNEIVSHLAAIPEVLDESGQNESGRNSGGSEFGRHTRSGMRLTEGSGAIWDGDAARNKEVGVGRAMLHAIRGEMICLNQYVAH